MNIINSVSPAHISSAASQSTPVGFEPTRGDPIGLAGRRLSRSAKVSDGRAELQADIGSSWAAALLASRSVVKEGPLFSADSASSHAAWQQEDVAAMHADDTCGIRAHAGKPHRLSRPTPWPQFLLNDCCLWRQAQLPPCHRPSVPLCHFRHRDSSPVRSGESRVS